RRYNRPHITARDAAEARSSYVPRPQAVVVEDTRQREADIANRRSAKGLVGLVAEQRNQFAKFAKLTAVHVELPQKNRLAQHNAKKRNRRALLGEGTAQIDTKVEKLGPVFQGAPRFGIHAFNASTGHMRIDRG
ncbi:MAG TPA: hypothetical protein VK561_21000, partial [Bradyrhizobium sp.]|nr:hypothetical protein [Bradyrhizobium sp.]